ncbi:MAG: hypothetical protein ABJ311_00210 [Erythrobacter sp.]
MIQKFDSVDTLVFVNNSICADMTRKWLLKENIDLSRVALVLLRKLTVDWADDCAACIRYPIKPKLTLMGQVHVLGFYRRAARFMKAALKTAPIRMILVPNNDNLLTNHVFRWAERHPGVLVVVVAEGIMNYQNVGYDNRAAWRWRAKVPIAAALGLQYSQPDGHLSGAFEDATDVVVSFASAGLTAPPEKVQVLQYPTVLANRPANPKVALILHSGLTHWMPSEDFEAIAQGFVTWLKAQEFDKIYAKRHPNVSAGMIEDIMPPHEIVEDSRPFEALLPDLEAGTLAGMCCTALITSKLMRPELRCVDFGANRYLETAYQGDQTVIKLMSAVGVEMVPLPSH